MTLPFRQDDGNVRAPALSRAVCVVVQVVAVGRVRWWSFYRQLSVSAHRDHRQPQYVSLVFVPTTQELRSRCFETDPRYSSDSTLALGSAQTRTSTVLYRRRSTVLVWEAGGLSSTQ